ncbi:hypothetical protein COCOBI_18-0690 [Coccomyxa sp. Obi]|nr:hypothetical protein COCOBI_18-0690 [Coccomyxa sp. Obi]
MSGSLLRSPGCLVYFALVVCYVAILANSGCEAQFLIDNGGGLGVLPPGLRLSQTLQQGGFGLPRPAIFGGRSFETLSAPSTPDEVAADTAASPDAAEQQPDLAAGPPPPPAAKVPPPPPPAPLSAATRRRNGYVNTTTSSAAAPAPGPESAPAAAPGLLAAGNTTAVSFSELIASAALAPAPHGVAPLLAPGPQPATNASSATAQPTQMTDLLAPAPAGAQGPPAAAAPQGPPSGGSRGDPQTEPQSGRSESGTCEAQGLSGQCNQCVCCCIPKGGGAFWRYVPSGGCDCAKIVSKPDIWIALALLGITVLPALLWAAYFAEVFRISPYKPRPQRLLVAAHPAAQNGH